MHRAYLSVRAEEAASIGVVDYIGLSVQAPDHHHYVTRDVDQVADLQRLHRGAPAFGAVRAFEVDALQRRALALVAGVARQFDAQAAVDLRHESAAIATVIGMAPAVSLTEELECLPQQVCARVGQGT